MSVRQSEIEKEFSFILPIFEVSGLASMAVMQLAGVVWQAECCTYMNLLTTKSVNYLE